MYRICKHSVQCNLQFKQPNYFLTDRISTLVRPLEYLFIRPLICNVHDQIYKEKKLKFSTVFSTLPNKSNINSLSPPTNYFKAIGCFETSIELLSKCLNLSVQTLAYSIGSLFL